MYSYFEGWYFKQQGQHSTVAIIPALHVDAAGRASASLQIITEEAAYCVQYPYEKLWVDQSGPCLYLGNSSFSAAGVHLDVRTRHLTASGRLRFGSLAPLQYDIMGPFCFVPFMECRHSVFSMAHRVTGRLRVNGKRYDFADALGYIEGDRGRSFPKRYAWTQYAWREESLCSLMLSVADIPLFGGGFTGVIGSVLWRGREYRIATYLGAKAVHIGQGGITVRQGPYTLQAQLLERGGLKLHAPVRGDMTRLVHENPSCPVQYRFTRGGEVLFDMTAARAGFEYEYDS